jgi:hypothetical protein
VSKFINRLKQISQPPPSAMGFRQNNEKTDRLKIQLVAFAHRSQDALASKLTAADAIIVPDIKLLSSDNIFGIFAEDGGDIDNAIKAGADFVILPSEAAVLPADKKIGKILQLDESVTDVLLRTVNDLPIDAVLVVDSSSEKAITWRSLMQFRRFTGMLSKPVLVTTMPDVSASDLQIIWETGVSGLVVDINSASDANSLNKMRELINGLSHPLPKKKERLIPFLPQGSHQATRTEEPDEDDDDDD